MDNKTKKRIQVKNIESKVKLLLAAKGGEELLVEEARDYPDGFYRLIEKETLEIDLHLNRINQLALILGRALSAEKSKVENKSQLN